MNQVIPRPHQVIRQIHIFGLGIINGFLCGDRANRGIKVPNRAGLTMFPADARMSKFVSSGHS
ncbi:hypothetical protein WM30_24590 [Burkholderia ubonensis]|nr:hypothetical protein WM30_24590 [Burkholderia ubonensis]